MLQLYIYIPIHYPYFHPAMATCVALVEFLEAGGKTTGCLVVPLIIPLLCYLGMVNFGEIHQVLVREFLAGMSIMYQDLHLGTSTKKRVYCIHQKYARCLSQGSGLHQYSGNQGQILGPFDYHGFFLAWFLAPLKPLNPMVKTYQNCHKLAKHHFKSLACRISPATCAKVSQWSGGC